MNHESPFHIFHITDRSTWLTAKKGILYQGDTLPKEGFIHCCFFEQIDGVLDTWFKGKDDLVIVEVDPGKLMSLIKYENLEGGTENFPHVYGPIDMDAVINEKFI